MAWFRLSGLAGLWTKKGIHGEREEVSEQLANIPVKLASGQEARPPKEANQRSRRSKPGGYGPLRLGY